MTVLFCSYDYPPRLGGQARLASDVVQGLKDASFRVTVVTSETYETDEPGVFPVLHRGRSATRNAILVRRRVGTDFDVIFASDSGISSRIAHRYSMKTGIPVVALCHGLDMQHLRRQTPAGAIDRRLARRSACTIANSTFTMEHAKQVFGPEPVRVIHPGVEIPERAVRTKPAKGRDPAAPKVLLTLGRLVKRKGHEVVLRALQGLDERFLYHVVGDGPERERLEALSHELGLADRVRFLGAVDEAAKQEQLASCDLCVMTPYAIEAPDSTDYEGFGIVYLEASALGKPVVASRSGGVPDAVSDGRSGLLVPPQSPDALRRVLRQLLRDDTLREKLAAGGLAWSRKFDRREACAAYASVVREVIDRQAEADATR